MEFSVDFFAHDEISYSKRFIGLDCSVIEACMLESQGSVQGVPRGLNNRTEVSFVLEGMRVSSDISVIVDHPTLASFSLGSKQVFLRDGGGSRWEDPPRSLMGGQRKAKGTGL